MLTSEQKEKLLEQITLHMEPDKYGKTTIRNIYLDTDNFRLIRRSIEKPAYKEKLRIRSYAKATGDSTVFVELKKKYKDVVYKRRLALCEKDAMAWVLGQKECPQNTQISREIDYFMNFYENPKPSVFLSYDRQAYYDKDKGDFRITLDENILCRSDNISLCADVYGSPILPQQNALMELKCSGGIPLWMTEILSKEKIYKTPFSKYGTAYSQLIFPEIHSKNMTTPKELIHNEYNI